MKALQIVDKEKMVLNEIEPPQIKDNEVLIKVAFCGICGSDLPRYFQGAVHQFPQILGHEFSGTIVKIGKNVQSLKKGERVTAAPLTVCGSCEYCLAGYPELCENYGFIGSHQPGALAEYVAVPETNIIKLPSNVSLKTAALVEPFTIGLSATQIFSLKVNETAVIFGAGTIGLMILTALRAEGLGKIIMIDINDKKLDFAHKLGADITINSSKTNLIDYFNDHECPTITFEAIGNPITQVQAILVTKKRGRVVYVGTSTHDVTFKANEFEEIFRKELLVTGSMMSYSAPFPGYKWPAAISLLKRRLINLDQMITATYSLEDGAKPFYDLTKKDSANIKVLYQIGGEE